LIIVQRVAPRDKIQIALFNYFLSLFLYYWMDLTQEEIQANIEKLRNRVGDPRTGGKGSQRRKVKVVSKTNVPIPYNSGWRRQSRQEHRQESGSAPSWR